MATDTHTYDLFISYASEDRAVAVELNEKLKEKGLNPWFAGDQLQLGDSLTQAISAGLTESQYGVVILSMDYLTNYRWTMSEFSSLFSFQTGHKRKVLLPVWHNITLDQIREKLPMMADVVGISTEKGMDAITDAILRVVKNQQATPQGAASLSQAPVVNKEVIRQEVEEGEMGPAIEKLLQLTKSTRYYNEALGTSGRWKRAIKSHQQGIMTDEDLAVSEAKIEQGILGLLDRMR